MKIAFFANTDWYLLNFRTPLIAAARAAGHDVVLISPQGEYSRQLTDLGFKWIGAPMERRSLNPLKELRLLLWLRRTLLEEDIDLVHNFTIKCAVLGSVAALLARRPRGWNPIGGSPARVNAIAGMGYVFLGTDLRARCLRPLVRVLMRMTLGGGNARLIVQNPDDARFFEDQHIVSREIIRLIEGSGVDCEKFAPDSPAAELAPNRVVKVLLPARLLWDKGIGEFVEAARRVREHVTDVEFLVAGKSDPGNPAAIAQETIEAWKHDGPIHWLGHVDDMAALYKSVDIVVLPSYREGLPKGLIEAGACAKPLIATDVPGCREVVSNGTNGLLVPMKDAAALARAIETLVADPALRRRMGQASRAKVMNRFSDQMVIRQTLAVYHDTGWHQSATRATPPRSGEA
ncbi:MAG: glycosyltransferase family 4 protein [Burkholderiaceae bacterium]